MPRKAKQADDPLVEIIAFRTGFIGPTGPKSRLVGPGTKYTRFKVRESQLSATWMKRVDGKPIARKAVIGNVSAADSAEVVQQALDAKQEEIKRLKAQIQAMSREAQDVVEAAKSVAPAADFGDEAEDGEEIEVTGQASAAELKAAEAEAGKDVL